MRAPVAPLARVHVLVLAILLMVAAWMAFPAAAEETPTGPPAMASEDEDAMISVLAGGALRVSADVALVDASDGDAIEPVVGSFTVDGLAYAIAGEGQVALVAVSPRTLADGLAGGSAAGLASASDGAEGEGASESAVLEVPEFVEHDGVTCSVVAIGPRAFAGCDADVVTIPAAVESIDELAFRGSAVAAIEVADGNPNFSSYDGMLFDAEQTSLLLIPEGKQGAARIPSTAEAVPPDAFSHCASVTSVTVDAGSAAFSSWNGCLYDASGETLLRVPAGAPEVVIADGCAAVAAGALEGCASLRSIQAPASVVEVSPDVLGRSAVDGDADGGAPVASLGSSSLPADGGGSLAATAGDAHAAEDGSAEGFQASSGGEGDEPSAEAEAAVDDGGANPVQLTSLVALAAAGNGLPEVAPASIAVRIPESADPAPWEAVGFKVEVVPSDAAGDAEPVEGEPLDDHALEDPHVH